MSIELKEVLKQRILPAVNIESADHALPVAEALLKAGLNVMEIQFRTAFAVQAIAAIRKNFPEMNIGAGTLLSVDQLKSAMNAGAQFGLSPSLNKTICEEANLINFPFIPGVMTPSDIEFAHELDYHILKLFPATQLGGASFLKAMLGPYQQLNVQFIPMGGVNINNMKEYMQLKNVIAVGGSWLVTKELQLTRNYAAIHNHAVDALNAIKNS